MINLLPPDNQRQLRAARVNVLLLRYVFLSLAAIALLALASAASLVMLNISRSAAEEVIADNNQKAIAYQSVDKQAKDFKADLQVAKTILDKEVRYSKIIVAIAQTLPENVVLDSLSLDVTTFGTPTSLSAKAKSYEDALILKSSLQESDIFSDVYLESVNESDSGSDNSDSDYPISININVTIKKEAAK